MADKCSKVLVGVFGIFYILLLLAGTVLQYVGFFSRKWILVPSCDIGINVICCGKGSNEVCLWDKIHGIHQATYGLQVSAMSFLGLGLLLIIGSILTTDPSSAVGAAAVCYPIAGLLSVIGCIVFATQASAVTLGYSFYVTLSAGCCITTATLLACLVVGCGAYHGDSDDNARSQRRGAGPPISLSHI